MSDSREWLYNLDLVRQNLSQRLVQRDRRYGIAFISELTQSPVRHSAANHLGVFIQTSNQLSQWRAYCPSMGGYESCFDFSELKAHLSRHEFQPEECIYDVTKQREIVADVISPIVGAIDALPNERAVNTAMEDATLSDIQAACNRRSRAQAS